MKYNTKLTAISPTMQQALLAVKLEPLEMPCFGDKDCECGRRLCPFLNSELKTDTSID